jgi:hypothetical protein
MKAKLLCVIAAGLALCATPLLAHHSFSAEYDRKKPIELKGTVTAVEWENPHIHFYMDVDDGTGKAVNWKIELASANGLARASWTRRVQVRDVVLVSGFRAKDGSNLANAQWVTLPNGKRMSGMSSIDDPALR